MQGTPGSGVFRLTEVTFEGSYKKPLHPRRQVRSVSNGEHGFEGHLYELPCELCQGCHHVVHVVLVTVICW